MREPKEGQGGMAAGKAAAPLFLDIVPEGKGSLKFSVTKGGQPYGEARVEVLAPNGWSRGFESGKDGKVEIQAPWPGLYIVKTTWKDQTPGEFKGRKYATASHAATLSFVKP